MDIEKLSINKIDPNKGQIPGLPKNPRFIKDERFAQLVQSLQDDPEMLELREIIVMPHEGRYVIIAGEMRYRGCKKLKHKTILAKILHIDTPVEKLRAYVIKDNAAYGSNDFELLANEWGDMPLDKWGLDLPADWLTDGNSSASGSEQSESITKGLTLKITFTTLEQRRLAQVEIQGLLDEKYNGAVCE